MGFLSSIAGSLAGSVLGPAGAIAGALSGSSASSSDIIQYGAPLAGAAGGFALGGPVGAMVGASVGGGISSAIGQQEANEQNIALAQQQMSFQERMSNTAYQRATADMIKAGINPAVAYSQGGATTPGGASTSVSPVDRSMGLGQALGSAVQLQNTVAQTDKIKSDTSLNTGVANIQAAQVRQMDASTRITNAQAAKAEAESDFYKSDFGKKWAIPLETYLGLGASAAGFAQAVKSLKPAQRMKQLSKDEIKILELYNKYNKKNPGRIKIP